LPGSIARPLDYLCGNIILLYFFMKKVVACFVLLIHLVGCIGITLNFHYCGGEIAGVALFQYNEENCCDEEAENEHGCCHDEYLTANTDDLESPSKFSISKNDAVRSLFTPHISSAGLNKYAVTLTPVLIPPNHAPPNNPHSPLFLKNCVLLI